MTGKEGPPAKGTMSWKYASRWLILFEGFIFHGDIKHRKQLYPTMFLKNHVFGSILPDGLLCLK